MISQAGDTLDFLETLVRPTTRGPHAAAYTIEQHEDAGSLTEYSDLNS